MKEKITFTIKILFIGLLTHLYLLWGIININVHEMETQNVKNAMGYTYNYTHTHNIYSDSGIYKISFSSKIDARVLGLFK